MAKKKFAHSDIPYAERLRMNKMATIAKHRDDAAGIALKVACVALNDTEGLGYTRLKRFALHLRELLAEYYEDPDIEDAHLNQRLRQIGFDVQDGHVYVHGEEEKHE